MQEDRYFSNFTTLFLSANTYALILIFCFISAFSGVNAQNIFVKQKDGTQTNYKLDDITKLTFSDGNLIISPKTGSSYTYPLSEIRYFNFKDLTSVSPESKVRSDDLLILYPNPSHSLLIIQLKSENIAPQKIEIVNLTGTIILSYIAMENATRQIDIDISSLSEGIYFCRVQTAQDILTKKFIKK